MNLGWDPKGWGVLEGLEGLMGPDGVLMGPNVVLVSA